MQVTGCGIKVWIWPLGLASNPCTKGTQRTPLAVLQQVVLDQHLTRKFGCQLWIL